MKYFVMLLCSFGLAACSSSSGGGAATTYKYQISGVSPLAVDPTLMPFAAGYVLKWNESVSGVVSGVFTDNASGLTYPVTGTSTPSGRTLDVNTSSAVGTVALVKIVIAQTGAINGSVSATVKTFDSNNVELSSQVVTVDAETTSDPVTPDPEDPPEEEEDPVVMWDNYGKIACWTERTSSTSHGSYPNTVVIDKAGDVYAWGENTYKRLGLPTEQVYTTPTKITFPSSPGRIIFVAIGNAIGAAIDENHKLYAWSGFAYPSSGSTVNNPTLISIPGSIVPAQVHFSKTNTYIVDTNGKVWSMGGDTYGQMGMGATDQGSTTFADTGIINVRRLMASPNDDSIFVIKNDGTLWGWGQGTGYRFTTNQTSQESPIQIFTSAGAGFVHMSRDYSSLMAVHSNGRAYTWGNQQSPRSKLGRSTVMSQWPDAAETFARNASDNTAFTGATAFTSGIGEFTYMVNATGSVYRWGANVFGDGTGNAISPTTGLNVTPVTGAPTNIESLKNCGDMMYAVTSTGALMGTGSQFKGALGNGVDSNVTNVLSWTTIGTLDLKD